MFFLYILFPETKNKTLIFLNLMITLFFLCRTYGKLPFILALKKIAVQLMDIFYAVHL